jgi:site-specific recombinase XerD
MRDRSPYSAGHRSPDSAAPTGHLTGARTRLALATAVAAHVADARARGLSERTVEFYVAGVDSYTASVDLGREPLLGDVTLEHARTWAAGLRAGRSPATAHGRVRALKTFARWCVAEGYLRFDPLERLALPLVPRLVVPAFGADQARALIAAATPELAIVLETLLDTGVRIGEATDLRLGDVGGGLITVRGKGGNVRRVPYGRTLDAHFRRYVALVRPRTELSATGHLFLGRTGHPATIRSVYQAMRRTAVAAGVTGVRVSPHTCRHTFAITFLRNGGNVFALQRALGHTDLEMVRRYVALADVDLVEAHATASPLDGWTNAR